MKRGYKSRNKRTMPQPASIGAPFLGAFNLTAAPQLVGEGNITIAPSALDTDGSPMDISVWPKSATLDHSNIVCFVDGVQTQPISLVTNSEGNSAVLTFVPGGAEVIMIKAGDENLKGVNGQVCGGVITVNIIA